MQITFNIKDEKQFLAEIKELVAAHIKQLGRDEALNYFDDELRRSLQNKVANISEYTMKDHIKDVLRQAIDKTLGSGWYNQEYVKKEADQYIKRISESELRAVKFVEVAEKTIKETAEKIKNDFLKKLLDK